MADQGESCRRLTYGSVPEGILMALSCPLVTKQTGEAKLMRNPVTLVADGIAYEHDYLLKEKPNLQEGIDFYPNIKLKTIINYIAANRLAPELYLTKLEKIEEDICDPLLMETMKDPVLSPSGFSYEKCSIAKWISSKLDAHRLFTHLGAIPDPMTQLDLRNKKLVPNINLQLFIKAWPEFYQEIREEQELRLDF